MGRILDNPIYAEAMASKRKTCYNCWHFREEHCSMFSCDCAIDVFRRASNPKWWASYEGGEEQERQVLRGHRFE